MASRFIPVYARPNSIFEVIVPWAGAIADIPEHWRFCDGTKSTPDCRDMFIRAVNPGGTGGANSLTFTHHHVSQGSNCDNETTHTHFFANQNTEAVGAGNAPGVLPPTGAATCLGTHNHTFNVTTPTSTHNHVLNGFSDDTTVTMDLRPPYLALAYMKGIPTDWTAGQIVYFDGDLGLLTQFIAPPGTPTTTLTADFDPNIDSEMFVDTDLGLPTPFVLYTGGTGVAVGVVDGGNPLHYTVAREQFGTFQFLPAGTVLNQPLVIPTFGYNGFPLIFNQFIVGAGDLYTVLSTLGQDDIVITTSLNRHSHDHGTTGAAASRHNHDTSNNQGSTPVPSIVAANNGILLLTVGGSDHRHNFFQSTTYRYDPITTAPDLSTLNDDANSEHTHTNSADPTLALWPSAIYEPGFDLDINTNPPYISLWAITKLAY